MQPIKFAVLETDDHVRMSDYGVRNTDGPRLEGVVIGYAKYKDSEPLLRVRLQETGTEQLAAPWHWQRISDGTVGKSPDVDDPNRRVPVEPLQTTYRGHFFRSRTEARWGVYWDALGVEWSYEAEGYSLPSGPYLPDFFLPQVSMFAEVKPTKFSGKERDKCFELATLTGFRCLMLDGAPKVKSYYAAHPEDNAQGVREEWPYYLTNHNGCATVGGNFHMSLDELLFRDTLRAVAAARSARFEHGECGMSAEAEANLRNR